MYELLLSIIFGASMWAMGFYAGYARKCRDIKREELRTAIKPSGEYKTQEGVKYTVLDEPVMLEDMWLDG